MSFPLQRVSLIKKDIRKEIQFQQVIGVGCGLDVHKDTIVATIRSSSKDYETKEFSSFTSSLTDLRDWC